MKAAAWLKSRDPVGHLLVTRISMSFSCSFLRYVECVSSERWQVKTWAAFGFDASAYDCRLLVAADGRLEAAAASHVPGLMSDSAWETLPARSRTLGLASVAFAEIYVVFSALLQFCFQVTRGCPYMLWLLLAIRVESWPRVCLTLRSAGLMSL